MILKMKSIQSNMIKSYGNLYSVVWISTVYKRSKQERLGSNNLDEIVVQLNAEISSIYLLSKTFSW